MLPSMTFLWLKKHTELIIFRCLDEFSNAEQDLLLSLVNAAANFECIQQSCSDFVSNKVRNMLGLKTDRYMTEANMKLYNLS